MRWPGGGDWFGCDIISELAECLDQFLGTTLLGGRIDLLTSFQIADAIVQYLPNDAGQAVSHRPNGGIVSQSRQQPAKNGLEVTSDLFDAGLRCHLYGHLWASRAFPKLGSLSCAWLADTFGFCSSLPILYSTMGISAVGFSRVPGSIQQDNPAPVQPRALAKFLFDSNATDFLGKALDGSSSVLVHWMQNKYASDPITKDNIEDVLFGGKSVWDGYAIHAPTQYCLVPLGDDLACPQADLATVIANWNQSSQAKDKSRLVAAGTVAQYVALLNFHKDRINAVDLRTNPPTPYWNGFYAMRPTVKRLLRQGTTALLAARWSEAPWNALNLHARSRTGQGD